MSLRAQIFYAEMFRLLAQGKKVSLSADGLWIEVTDNE